MIQLLPDWMYHAIDWSDTLGRLTALRSSEPDLASLGQRFTGFWPSESASRLVSCMLSGMARASISSVSTTCLDAPNHEDLSSSQAMARGSLSILSEASVSYWGKHALGTLHAVCALVRDAARYAGEERDQ